MFDSWPIFVIAVVSILVYDLFRLRDAIREFRYIGDWWRRFWIAMIANAVTSAFVVAIIGSMAFDEAGPVVAFAAIGWSEVQRHLIAAVPGYSLPRDDIDLQRVELEGAEARTPGRRNLFGWWTAERTSNVIQASAVIVAILIAVLE